MQVGELSTAEAEAALPGLVALLADAVDGGASVGFMAGLDAAAAEAFWRAVIADVAGGRAFLFAAHADGELVGTVLLQPTWKPNQPHRADVAKLLVLRAARRNGVASALMQAMEAKARALGRLLLTLDTETGSPAETLYRRRGYVLSGSIPGYALRPDGALSPTSIYYKQLR